MEMGAHMCIVTYTINEYSMINSRISQGKSMNRNTGIVFFFPCVYHVVKLFSWLAVVLTWRSLCINMEDCNLTVVAFTINKYFAILTLREKVRTRYNLMKINLT